MPLDAYSYGCLLDGYAAAGEASRAAAWLRRLRRCELRVDGKALMAVARSCEAQGEAKEAARWMEGELEDEHLHLYIYIYVCIYVYVYVYIYMTVIYKRLI